MRKPLIRPPSDIPPHSSSTRRRHLNRLTLSRHLCTTPHSYIVHEVDETSSITVHIARGSAMRTKRALINFQSCLINNFSTFCVPTDDIQGPIEHTGHGRRFLLHAPCFFCSLRCFSLLLSALLQRHSTPLAEEPPQMHSFFCSRKNAIKDIHRRLSWLIYSE